MKTQTGMVMEIVAVKKYTNVKKTAEVLAVEPKEAKRILDMMVKDGVLSKINLSRQVGHPMSYTLTEKGKMINSL